MIEARRLGHAVGSRPILRAMDFDVKENDFVLIFGPNGAGKSTLMKILAGALRATAGEVLLEGRNVAHCSRRELAALMSFLPQADEFSLPLLVRDVLLAGRYPYRSLFKGLGDRDRELFASAVERFRLQGLLQRNIQTLSGGERKKVLLACSFIQDVPLILLDEPLNFLDPESSLHLTRALAEMHRDGKTIVVVAHEIERFFPFATKMLALKSGEKIYFGDKVFSRELLREVYRVDFQKIALAKREIIFVNE